MQRSDFTGQKFGRLIVIGMHEIRARRTHWLCRCKCGNETVVSGSNLRATAMKPIRSCGCLRRETAGSMGKATRKHGEAINRTVEYLAWRNIKNRCYNPNTPNWKYYGAIGVKVCKRWRDSFDNFLADMGRRPAGDYSIDRYPNPYGNYEPKNCRWATPLQQRHNRREAK